MIALGCLGHIIHTITEAEFRTVQLIPKLHDVSGSMKVPSVSNNVFAAMAALVHSEADIFEDVKLAEA